ncbi:MAG: hypothetical protein EPN91_04755 [Salinibacterium sp.]|nr:MAG: hypothetical protein EPN91_04755 [Salinibacterium sp.]
MKRAALILASSLLALAAADLAVRIVTRVPEHERAFRYDTRLGWAPREDFVGIVAGAPAAITADGLRASGHQTGRPILAVGDSYTFGAEVADAETWPAYLAQLTGRRVLNGGVNGYGADQAILRAETLTRRYQPDTIVLGLIQPDIRRSLYSRHGRAKPYVVTRRGATLLCGVPVPHDATGILGLIEDHHDVMVATTRWRPELERMLGRFRSLAPRTLLVLYGHDNRSLEFRDVRLAAISLGLGMLDLSDRLGPEFYRRQHFNPAGNLFVSNEIAKVLQQ